MTVETPASVTTATLVLMRSLDMSAVLLVRYLYPTLPLLLTPWKGEILVGIL
jgi:hypothetical protein